MKAAKCLQLSITLALQTLQVDLFHPVSRPACRNADCLCLNARVAAILSLAGNPRSQVTVQPSQAIFDFGRMCACCRNRVKLHRRWKDPAATCAGCADGRSAIPPCVVDSPLVRHACHVCIVLPTRTHLWAMDMYLATARTSSMITTAWRLGLQVNQGGQCEGTASSPSGHHRRER